MRYKVASLDVILDEGWEINDLHEIGVIDIDADAIDDDEMILNILNEVGYTNDLTTQDTEIDGDETLLTLIDFETGRPLYQLIFDGA